MTSELLSTSHPYRCCQVLYFCHQHDFMLDTKLPLSLKHLAKWAQRFAVFNNFVYLSAVAIHGDEKKCIFWSVAKSPPGLARWLCIASSSLTVLPSFWSLSSPVSKSSFGLSQSHCITIRNLNFSLLEYNTNSKYATQFDCIIISAPSKIVLWNLVSRTLNFVSLNIVGFCKCCRFPVLNIGHSIVLALVPQMGPRAQDDRVGDDDY